MRSLWKRWRVTSSIWHGAGAVNVLRDRAEQASVEEDPVSEQAWRDIANAAARITAAGSG
jgi:hypothetical protein